MQLSIKGAAIAGGLLWGGAFCSRGCSIWPTPVREAFLQVMSSIYPGFHSSHTFVDVIVGTLYGIVDGALAGLIFAWLYNGFSR